MEFLNVKASLAWKVVVSSRIFRELLSEGNGLLPGRIQGSRAYLGHEAFMASSRGRACCDERRKKFYDSVCSGPSSIAGDWRSGVKPWPC
jgi:hypothetical protein